MVSNVIVELMKADGSVTVLEVLPDATYDTSSLTVIRGEFVGRTFVGGDLFDAMIALREELETVGGKLLCAGARRDVWPSGMSRSMGSARKAYVLELGKPGVILVDIFEPAEPANIGTVKEQSDFRQRWVAAWLERGRT